MNESILWIVIGVPAFILSGTFHEYMHAWTAKKLGDYTATMEGRLSLNPLVHLDPWGLLLMVFARFGWMKPVPINEFNFKNRVRDVAIVAAAGPLTNITLATIGIATLAIITKLALGDSQLSFGAILSIENQFLYFLSVFLYIFSFVNIGLTIFNLLPIPPLDGFRIVRALMPKGLRFHWDKLENYSFIIVLLLFLPFSPFSNIISTIMSTGVLSIFNTFSSFFTSILG